MGTLSNSPLPNRTRTIQCIRPSSQPFRRGPSYEPDWILWRHSRQTIRAFLLRVVIHRHRQRRDDLGGTQDVAMWGTLAMFICLLAAVIAGLTRFLLR